MPRPIERVKLMPDYGADVPLWTGSADWQEIGLPAHVIDRLRSWQSEFDDGFRVDQGWLDPDRREAWTRESERLVELLHHHVDSNIEIVVDLWPITVGHG